MLVNLRPGCSSLHSQSKMLPISNVRRHVTECAALLPLNDLFLTNAEKMLIFNINFDPFSLLIRCRVSVIFVKQSLIFFEYFIIFQSLIQIFDW
jgi:hypothetical protein